MKANELMIGDWVYNKNIDKPMQVYPMMFSQMFRQKPNATTEDYNIFPIPLTAEILEKNEFDIICLKPGQAVYSLADDYYDLGVEEISDSIWRVEYWDLESSSFDAKLQIAFVHELQHALRLCGIEKEIVL